MDDSAVIAFKNVGALAIRMHDDSLDVTIGSDTRLDAVSELFMRAVSVRSVTAADCAVTTEVLEGIVSLKALRVLTLDKVDCRGVRWEALSHQACLERLRMYDLASSDMAECVESLSRWSRICELRIRRCALSDSDLRSLPDFASLAELFIENEQVGVGLAVLRECPRLAWLGVAGTLAGDECVSCLQESSSLTHLWLTDCPVTDLGMESISRMSQLEVLNISGTKITSAGLTLLSQLRTLDVLGVDGLPLDHGALAALCRMQWLGHLSVERCRLTSAQGAMLRSSLPFCSIAADDEDLLNDPDTRALLKWLHDVAKRDEPIDEHGGIHVETWVRDGDWFCERFGAVCRIRSLELGESGLTDEGLAKICGMTWLQDIGLESSRLTGPGLAVLSKLPSLRNVGVSVRSGARQGLEHLGNCRELRSLRIVDWPALSTWMRHLGHLRQLEELFILGSLWDGEFEVLQSLESLRLLCLSGSGTPDSGLEAASRVPGLQRLSLASLPASDAGLRFLSNCPRLVEIAVDSCPVTDCGVEALGGCKNLKSVDLRNLKIRGSGLRALRRLPHLKQLLVRSIELDDDGVNALCDLNHVEEIAIADIALTREQLDRLARSLSHASIAVRVGP